MAECAICLSDVPPADEAFLLPHCYHKFHYACIAAWTRAQELHPRQQEGAPVAQPCLCPLCKRPYTCILYDCEDRAFKCLHVKGGGDSPLLSLRSLLQLTTDQQRRRSVFMRLQETTGAAATSRAVTGAAATSRDTMVMATTNWDSRRAAAGVSSCGGPRDEPANTSTRVGPQQEQEGAAALSATPAASSRSTAGASAAMKARGLGGAGGLGLQAGAAASAAASRVEAGRDCELRSSARPGSGGGSDCTKPPVQGGSNSAIRGGAGGPDFAVARRLRPPRKTNDPVAMEWMRRDLQALLLQDDVELVLQHAWGTLQAAAATPAAAAPSRSLGSAAKASGKPWDTKKRPRCSKQAPPGAQRPLAAEEAGAAVAALGDAMHMFLPEHSRAFARELHLFLASGLSVKAYDEVAAGRDATDAAAAAAVAANAAPADADADDALVTVAQVAAGCDCGNGGLDFNEAGVAVEAMDGDAARRGQQGGGGSADGLDTQETGEEAEEAAAVGSAMSASPDHAPEGGRVAVLDDVQAGRGAERVGAGCLVPQRHSRSSAGLVEHAALRHSRSSTGLVEHARSLLGGASGDGCGDVAGVAGVASGFPGASVAAEPLDKTARSSGSGSDDGLDEDGADEFECSNHHSFGLVGGDLSQL